MRRSTCGAAPAWAVLALGCVTAASNPPTAESAHVAAAHAAPARDDSTEAFPPPGAAVPDLEALSWPERVLFERALAEHDPRFAPRLDEAGITIAQPGGVSAIIGPRGASLTLGAYDLRLAVAGVGRTGALEEIGDARANIAHAEVGREIAAGIVEWWRALPSGLEHGVTLTARPAGAGPLVVDVAVSGLTPRAESRDSIALVASGVVVARYAHLFVSDATGASLPARLSTDGDTLRIEVDDEGARYPLVVDPIVALEEATLLASDGVSADQFGFAVALSSDGSRALVGAFQDATAAGAGAGSARVFLRTGTTWALEAVLEHAGAAPGDNFGVSVALSGAGDRALVGAPRDDSAMGSDAGTARVFVRTGANWTEEASVGPAGAPGTASLDRFGSAVSLSTDGTRALVGAPYDDTAAGVDAGSAYVFVLTGATWTQEAMLLTPAAAAGDRLGSAVALSGDGAHALLGAPYDDTAAGTDAGTARVYLRSGVTWTLETVLADPAGGTTDLHGFAVALDGGGTRALVGAPFFGAAGVDAGHVTAHARTGTTWAHETTLVGSASPGNGFGYSVALSDTGALALVGTPYDRPTPLLGGGTATLFVRSSTTWAAETTFWSADAADGDTQGYDVALSGDGTSALLGAPSDDTTGMGLVAGSARVFRLLATRADGAACVLAAECTSGFCVDGVCCATGCGGGAPNDCQACSAALTGGTSGTCAGLSAAIAPTITCRTDAGACDASEACTAGSTACPVDAFLGASSQCRASASACDAAEVCPGTSPDCPADAPAAPGTECRAATGACDGAEVCSGSAFACPGDGYAPSGIVCRGVADACDAEERCTGASPVCPPDAFAAPSTVCRAATGACDVQETCTGIAAACPANLFAPATTSCGSAVSGDCDAPDHCSGTSADCIDAYLASVECRGASGPCDIAENCLGDSPSCPADALAGAGLSCRASIDPTCDPEERCDGVAASCPADVITCSARPDAGPRDAATTPDGGTEPDAGAPPAAATGCRCAAPRRGASGAALLGLGLVLVGAARLTRRRRSP